MIKNQTKLTRAAFDRLNHVRFMSSNFIMIIVFCGIAVLYGAATIWMQNYTAAIFAFCMAVIYPLIVVLSHHSRRNRLWKSSAELQEEPLYEYTFLEDSVQVEILTDERVTPIYFFYDKLFRIVETKDAFFLYTNTNNALIVNKEGFIEGDSDALRELLKGLNKSYKVSRH